MYPHIHSSRSSSMTLELIDCLECLPGYDWSCVTLSFSIISPKSVIVFWETIPCGAISACRMSKAKSGGRGSDQPWITSRDMCLASEDDSPADL